MRTLFIVIIIFCVSCSKSNNNAKSTTDVAVDSLPKFPGIEKPLDSSQLVKIKCSNGKSAYFKKESYLKYEQWFKKLNFYFVHPPDEARAIFENGGLQQKFKFSYGPFLVSEFYILYGHLLKERNGANTDDALRQKANRAFESVNNIYAKIGNGSPMYYAFQEKTIPGYAEFVVYNYTGREKAFQTNFDIKPQRQLYIQGLKQEIYDAFYDKEVKQSNYPEQRDEMERKASLARALQHLDELESQIKTYYDLKSVQQFHYSHYY